MNHDHHQPKTVDLKETMELRCESDKDRDSFSIRKRKRDAQREESAGNELEDSGFSRRPSSNTWLFASVHNQQRSNSVVVPKEARSSNNSAPKKTSISSSPTTEKHIEIEIAELLYGSKTSRNQGSLEKLETDDVYDLASKSSTAELVKIDDDTKSYVPNKDIKKVNLESMAPKSSETRASALDVELGNKEDMKIDIEVPNKKDNDILTNHQVKETVPWSSFEPAWSRNLPPLGYVPPSLQPIVKADKTIGSSTTLQLVDFVPSPPRPKRCACHHYIARNIFLHQQLLRANNIWPGAVNSSSSRGTKRNNFNYVPTPEQQSQNDFLGVKKDSTQAKKEPVASKSPTLDTNRSLDSSSSPDSMQMEQQHPYIMHQPSPAIVTSHARGGNSSRASSSNNSSLGETSSVRGALFQLRCLNSSTSIGLPSSHKQSYGIQVKSNNITETCHEKSSSIVGQKNVNSQNFTMPSQPKNFSLRSSITSNTIIAGKNEKQEALKAGFELVSSQSFAISFQSQPSVAWQGYHRDDENKVNSGKSSTTLVFDDSSKYLSFVLSPTNGNWLHHSQHKASNSTTSVTEPASKSFLSQNVPHSNSHNPCKSSFANPKVVSQEQGRVLQGHQAQISFGENYKSFPPLQVQGQLSNNQSSNITFARYLPNGGNSKTSKVCSTVS